jgi:tetratricopeptide (TPR) repeat protein
MDDNIQPEIDTIWDEAKSFIEQGSFDRAIETYKYILIRYDDAPIAVECANANLGDIYLTLGQLDSAEIYINKAISCDPRKPDYHYLLGFVYSKQSHWENAVKEFQAAIKVEPDNPEYLRGLGWAMFSSGYKSKGLQYLHEAK